jgi:hypothetical protein
MVDALPAGSGSSIILPPPRRTSTSRREPWSSASLELTLPSLSAAAGPSAIDLSFAPVAGL